VGRQDLIIGCLLGDGRLECRAKSGTARFRVHQADSQKDYVFWKFNLLKKICLTKPREIVTFDKRYQKKLNSWYFHTQTTQQLGKLHRIFYRRNKKVIPGNLGKLLTAQSLAVWVMDDGCYNNGSLILNTQGFSLNEQRILQKVLFKNFGIQSGINKDRNNFRLRILKESFLRLVKIISPHIIPSMKYKLVPVTTESDVTSDEIPSKAR